MVTGLAPSDVLHCRRMPPAIDRFARVVCGHAVLPESEAGRRISATTVLRTYATETAGNVTCNKKTIAVRIAGRRLCAMGRALIARARAMVQELPPTVGESRP